MKRAAAVLALIFTLSNTALADPVLFYGGDFDANNPNAEGIANCVGTTGFGGPVQTYQNFVIPSGQTWTITGLFSNNLQNDVFSSAVWEIRSGLSAGNGGALIASGSSAVTQTATGRSLLGFTEFNTTVTGLSQVLGAGTYWFNVAPVINNGNLSYNSNTFGLNSVGTSITDQQFVNSGFGFNFINANYFGTLPNLSDGVLGRTTSGQAPEIGSAGVGGVLALLVGGIVVLRGRRLQPV
jgi:hypothetical protein